jgi:ElaB/YqjD/DUF883 family membrane-anchored ribosome-binding protein
MAEEPSVIRHQIEETRESLTEKLETLEDQVKEAVGTVTDTIETVKSSVENTVESVKTGVEGTVESVRTSFSDAVDSVKETFDLSSQVNRHPWGAVGCSLLAGVAAGYLLTGSRRAGFSAGIRGMERIIPGYQPSRPAEPPPAEIREESHEPDLLSKLLGSFEAELGKIKRTALGAALGMARDVIKEALPPSIGDNVTEIMDNITRRVGAEPVRGPVLEPEHAGAQGGARSESTY